MSLFQKSVLSKYLKASDENACATQWQAFKQHFHNPTIQQNIKNSKEEQYQEGFLNDLFVKVLGYIKNPEPNFNLTTELKNISNAKKTDGAIIIDNKTIAVIELKGTNTTDLSKVETQAFNYKNNQPDAIYVITSNFEKLRFYIDNAVDFMEFNLFQLTEVDFNLMWLCLAHQNLSKGLAQKIKNESLFNEENITKQLYKDYSTFKNELFASIQQSNPQYNKLILYKKTQKLLDRFLFIFFAEDRLLLPPNSIRAILKQWQQLKDLDEYKPLYSRYSKYFGYMNTGFKGRQHDIFAYNGGLFAPDEILDNIIVDDEVLAKHTQNLSNYDFESEVSVNILGHIFEHSLNEIESITAELEGKAIDTKKTKRKKDGVFYTPKYITKYIVENTVGKLCTEKKTELQIEEADYAKVRKGRKKETLKKLQQQLESYRNWLLTLTICDPACGSGAFLNQALEFLITEHRYIDELQAKLLNEPMILSDIENSILENNLFGVDINEESVDIAKLSLWLRTAQKGRKLTTLSSNIKCGNSLIDDPAIAGAKAFSWQQEFPQVFEPIDKQAFHVVLTTHNSRTSQRMSNYNVKTGTPIELNLKQAIKLTQIIGDIIKEQGYHCLAYNVCKDHVHLILVSDAIDLSKQVKRIKSVSSRLMGIPAPMEPVPLSENTTSEQDHLEGVTPLSEPAPTEPVPLSENTTSEQVHLKGVAPLSEPAPTEPVSLSENTTSEQVHLEGVVPLSAPTPTKPVPLFENTTSEQVHLEGVTPLSEPAPTKPVPLSENTTSEQVHLEQGGTHKKGNKYYTPFWSQKFFFANLDVWELNTGQANGYNYGHTYIDNAIAYINTNRVKHQLPQSAKLEKVIESFVTTSEKAFEPKFEGGFDVVIGNPPYVMANDKLYIEYITQKCSDLYAYFFEKGISVLCDNGYLGYITPSSFFTNIGFVSLRNYLLDFKINSIIDLGEKIFADASVDSGITIISKTKEAESLIRVANHNFNFRNIKKSTFRLLEQNMFNIYINSSHLEIVNRFETRYIFDDYLNFSRGVEFGFNSKNVVGEKLADNYPIVCGGNILRNRIYFENKYVNYEQDNLKIYKSKNIYLNEKILVRRIGNKIISSYDDQKYFNVCDVYNILLKEDFKNKISLKVISSILNSKLIAFYFNTKFKSVKKLFPKIPIKYLRLLPIVEESGLSNDRLLNLSTKIIFENKNLQNIIVQYIQLLASKFQIIKLSKKLQNWPTLEFSDFLKELKKAKVKLSLSEEAEWMQYFNEQKAKATELQNQINQTDTEIDQMVYQLYGLTDEEIKIVEASVK